MTKTKNKINVVNIVFITTFCIILFLYALSIIGILLWGVLTSLKSNSDFLFMNNVLGFPNLEKSKDELFGLANYRLMLENFKFTKKVTYYSGEQLIVRESTNGIFQMLLNTLLYAGIGCFLAAIVPAITSFMCVKFKQYRLARMMYAINLVVMTLPLVGTAPATIELLRMLNLYDSFVGMTIQKFAFTGMYFLVFYAFYEGLTDSYQEAAELDGASYYTILFKIILPLSLKLISTTMLLQFVTLWNDYQTPLLYLPTHPTLSYGVYYMSSELTIGNLSKVPARVAGCMLLAIPIFVIFLFLRNKLMGNISVGGVKE